MRADFFKEEVICDYRVTEKMKRIWAVQLDLLEKFIDVCDRNGLTYFVSYGTLLGAVRHNGYIPWDDDIDIMMPRKDYNLLKLIAEKEFSHPYFFQTPENDPENFTAGGCRLRNSNTTYIEYLNLGHNCNNGCYIDITALDGVFDNKLKRHRQIKRVDRYKSLLYAKVYGKDFVTLFDHSKLQWGTLRFLAKLFPHKWLCQQFDNACSACGFDETTKLGIFTQKNGDYEYRYFDKDIFEQTVKLDFEHINVPIPADYMRYILTVWDKGMELPPLHERKPKHEGFFDTETPYKEHALPIFTDVFKDIKGKRIFLFGAGLMLDDYMKKHGKKYQPEFVFDNDPNKWGTIRHGIVVKNPAELPSLLEENTRLIIVNIYYREIGEQLRKLGINQFYAYLQDRNY
ncbi:LicD family protein [Paenibacillus arenosi]|uniref:LicD family protein n=1 Tax=Paenibacillus arenosi TaxID=2774142 RepID=A0ABR9AV45_9BACL|nr:LicD family protein [Paenibacillus arenosi]MBD8497958.1 LicD family protein [Paenibacillus arenosi]